MCVNGRKASFVIQRKLMLRRHTHTHREKSGSGNKNSHNLWLVVLQIPR